MARLPSFRTRAAPHTLPEKMDGAMDYATFEAYLASLASVNAATLGHRPTLRFADRLAARRDPSRPLRIVDIGSGYGDTLCVLAAHLAARGIPAELTGVDRNPHAAKAARRHPSVTYLTQDAADYIARDPAPDAIISSLLAHHLEDEELVAFLRFMDRSARIGWFVNDLLRSRFAASGFGVLARLTRRHPYIAHDGRISFARAFRRGDWQRLLAEADVSGARIHLGAPFRLCVEKLHPDG